MIEGTLRLGSLNKYLSNFFTLGDFSWSNLPWYYTLPAILGVFLLILLVKQFFNQSILAKNKFVLIISYLIFLSGLYFIFHYKIYVTFADAEIIIGTFILNLMFYVILHLIYKSNIQTRSDFIKRYGYYESKDKLYANNAASTRFGITVIGRSGRKSAFDHKHPILSFFKDLIFPSAVDGWTGNQRKAILLHERGHSIFGTFFIFLESVIFYLFVFNLIHNFSYKLFPIWLAAITILSWLEELMCDFWAGYSGFSLFGDVFNFSVFSLLGGIGANSHPPIILRCVAFLIKPIMFVFILFLILRLLF